MKTYFMIVRMKTVSFIIKFDNMIMTQINKIDLLQIIKIKIININMILLIIIVMISMNIKIQSNNKSKSNNN